MSKCSPQSFGNYTWFNNNTLSGLFHLVVSVQNEYLDDSQNPIHPDFRKYIMSRFHFITEWSLQATPAEVYTIIHDSGSLMTWWPSVYLDVKTLKEGDIHGIGKIISLYTKGYLPYTLRWSFEVVEIIKNNKIAIKAFGDLNGTGVWTFYENLDQCKVIYDWDITFDKPYLSKFTWLLRPIFEFNHKWAMKKGLQSLELEIRRRRGEVNVPDAPKAVLVF